MQSTKADAVARALRGRPSRHSPVARRLNPSKLKNPMKYVFIFMMLLLLVGCANPHEGPQNTGPTEAEVKARDDFAKNLPKPPER
jgi:hypothetical protein